MSNPITINGVRFSYCNLFQPRARKAGQEPKYSTTILLPKVNAQAKALIDQAIAQAIETGVNKSWNGVRPPNVQIPVHDGDGVRESGEPFGEECKGCWVFTANSKQAPFVVDAQVQSIINPTEVYSGMYGNVNVTFFPYYADGRKGVGCGLNGVQKVSDGEPLAGTRVTAESAFSAVQSQAAPAYGSPAPSAPSGGYPPQGGYSPAPGQNFPQTPPAAPQQGYPAATPQNYPPQGNQQGYGQAPGYQQAAPQGYAQNPGYQQAAPQGYAQNPGQYQQYVDPAMGEVLNGYPQNGYAPSGLPVAGI